MTATAMLLAGCSSDVSRFNDPFSNPFDMSSGSSDKTPTGSIPSQTASLSAPKGSPIDSQPLGAPTAVRSAPAAHAAASSAPILPSRTVASAPVTHQAPAAAAGAARWSPEGGSTVVVGQGETAAVVATRFGVPLDVLLRVNGFTAAGQVAAGTRLIVPVYNAGGGTAAAGPAAAKTAAKTAAPMHFASGPTGRQASAAPAPKGPSPAVAPATKLNKVQAAKNVPAKGAVSKDPKVKDVKTKIAAVVPVKTVPGHVAAASPAPAQPAPHGAAHTAPGQAAQLPAQTLVAITPAQQPKAAPPVDPTPTGTLAANTEPAAAPGPGFRWPAHGRIINGFKAGSNDGINIALPEGSSIKAADDGVVAYAGSELKGYGNLVLIRHSNGFVTAYADNQELEVKRGDVVKRGQVIAKSGQTGSVTSPQLHFELRKGSTPVDPTNFLAAL